MLVNVGKEITFLFSPLDFSNFLAEGDFRKSTSYAVKRVPFHVFD